MLDAPQDRVGPFDCQGMLLAHVQLAINSDPQISLCGAALQPLIPQFVPKQDYPIPSGEFGTRSH